MKLTIETTKSEPDYSFKVSKEVPYDDLDIWTMGALLWEVLVAMGYAPESVDSILESEIPDEKVQDIWKPSKELEDQPLAV